MKIKDLTRPKRLVAELGTLTQSYGKFIAEPLERGFGHTIGNSLRRVLLSSLKGASIASVKIDGALHEFSTLPGVMEDVIQIVLNLKQIRLKSHSEEPMFLYLEAQGEGEVTAADIQPNGRVEILNPDQLIATLDKNGKLSMEMTVETGRGYIFGEQNSDQPIGAIPIDAFFSPVRKVDYHVEETRVGHMTNFDKLTIEIWTDGSISPKESISEAARIMSDYLNLFFDFDENYVEVEEKVDEEQEKKKQFLSKLVSELELSVRSANCLEAAGIITIKDLVTKTESEMLKYRNFGRKSLNEIKAILTDMGLSFGVTLGDGNE